MRGASAVPNSPGRRWMGRPWVVAAVLAASVGLTLTGCATTQTAQTPPGATTQALPAASGVFTARTVNGAQVAVPGSKPTVLFFFSVECGSCGPESTVLAQVQHSAPHGANYVVVDVAPSETTAVITSFLAQNNASSMAFATDTNAQLISAYHVQDLSTAVVLNASGTVVFRAVDPSAGQIRDALTKAGTR